MFAKLAMCKKLQIVIDKPFVGLGKKLKYSGVLGREKNEENMGFEWKED